MRAFQFFWSLGLTAAALSAQSAGVPPEWETRKFLDSIVANAKKLEPLVKEVLPAEWVEKGASPTYVSQWKRVTESVTGLQAAAAQLAKEPTRLSFTLDTMFRLENLRLYLDSLAAGVRRYQNPALADLLLGVGDENASNSAWLKQYAQDLAVSKEGELRVMEAEAQRCLAIVVKQPPPARPKPTARKDPQ